MWTNQQLQEPFWSFDLIFQFQLLLLLYHLCQTKESVADHLGSCTLLIDRAIKSVVNCEARKVLLNTNLGRNSSWPLTEGKLSSDSRWRCTACWVAPEADAPVICRICQGFEYGIYVVERFSLWVWNFRSGYAKSIRISLCDRYGLSSSRFVETAPRDH